METLCLNSSSELESSLSIFRAVRENNEHKLKKKGFQTGRKEHFFQHEDSPAVVPVTQKGCAVSILHVAEDPRLKPWATCSDSFEKDEYKISWCYLQPELFHDSKFWYYFKVTYLKLNSISLSLKLRNNIEGLYGSKDTKVYLLFLKKYRTGQKSRFVVEKSVMWDAANTVLIKEHENKWSPVANHC